MPRDVPRREELVASYAHPYRTWLPVAWEISKARSTLAMGIAAGAAGGVLSASGDVDAWAWLGLTALVIALAMVAFWTVLAASYIRRTTQTWKQPSELGSVRARRPHASAADPLLAHDEFAVTVEDDGALYIWRYRPLLSNEAARAGELLVPGRPQYGAAVAEMRTFDGQDAALAAEHLLAAQARAATLEAEAAATAENRRSIGEAQRELAAETTSTAAALKHLTGQKP